MQNSAKIKSCCDQMSEIFWEGHAPSAHPTFTPRLWGLDFEPPPLQISGYVTGIFCISSQY